MTNKRTGQPSRHIQNRTRVRPQNDSAQLERLNKTVQDECLGAPFLSQQILTTY
ncbi:hypothetical protein HYX70_01645 [Candidatus Saccharibacteria bacterium]|nr:hypothetical protein [Candidatus Saccharibacteria bacterium]